MDNYIKYIGFYETPSVKYKRNAALSAMAKMNYISDVVINLGYKISIISPSIILGKGFQLQKKIRLTDTKQIILTPSIGSFNKFFSYLSIILSQIWLFLLLLFKAKKDEKIIVYHSPWIVPAILLAKKIKKFKIILEVEEIYKSVQSIHYFLDNFEERIFSSADSYIFSTELLEKKLNKGKKPFVILYGTYDVPETLKKPLDDGKIHLLYAGIIDNHKGGAFNAVETALYLDGNYIIHIIGFGEVDRLLKRIEEINMTSQCKVYYDGIKSGDEYIKFCQSCHIGLSTQNVDGEYVDTSFPSKVLSYMGLGLNVISCKIKCVHESQITDFVNYYNGSPKDIAKTIKKIKFIESDKIKNMIFVLDQSFKSNINNLLH